MCGAGDRPLQGLAPGTGIAQRYSWVCSVLLLEAAATADESLALVAEVRDGYQT